LDGRFTPQARVETWSEIRVNKTQRKYKANMEDFTWTLLTAKNREGEEEFHYNFLVTGSIVCP